MGIENPVHLLFIAVVALVVLGPKRLPGLARAVGNGIREFREAIGHATAPSTEPVLGLHAGEASEPARASEPAPADPTGGGDPSEPLRSADAPDRRAV